jgi:predicted dehydrogenase
MQQSPACQVVAIASRNAEKAQAAAAQFGLPRAYGDYADLLADGQIDAIYNPRQPPARPLIDQGP